MADEKVKENSVKFFSLLSQPGFPLPSIWRNQEWMSSKKFIPNWLTLCLWSSCASFKYKIEFFDNKAISSVLSFQVKHLKIFYLGSEDVNYKGTGCTHSKKKNHPMNNERPGNPGCTMDPCGMWIYVCIYIMYLDNVENRVAI